MQTNFLKQLFEKDSWKPFIRRTSTWLIIAFVVCSCFIAYIGFKAFQINTTTGKITKKYYITSSDVYIWSGTDKKNMSDYPSCYHNLEWYDYEVCVRRDTNNICTDYETRRSYNYELLQWNYFVTLKDTFYNRNDICFPRDSEFNASRIFKYDNNRIKDYILLVEIDNNIEIFSPSYDRFKQFSKDERVEVSYHKASGMYLKLYKINNGNVE